MHRAGKHLAAFERAVGDCDAFRMLRGEVRGAELDHFSGAYEEDAFLLQRAEKAQRKANSRSCEADGVGADRCGGANFLGNREG